MSFIPVQLHLLYQARIPLILVHSKSWQSSNGCYFWMNTITGNIKSVKDFYMNYLAALHYQVLMKNVVTAKSFVHPGCLSPTDTSTKFHCVRLYYQTMIWMSMATEIYPVNWGWILYGDELVPIMCYINAAPNTLFKIIHCNCKTGCSDNRCGCRPYRLP